MPIPGCMTTPIAPSTSIQTLPHDVLVQITAELAALQPRGPPAVALAFLSTCSHLAGARSPVLSASIFRCQFDTRAHISRGLSQILTPTVLDWELPIRWRALKRIRWAASSGSAIWGHAYAVVDILHDMRIAYTLLIENDSMNWEQLVGWAMLRAYVQAFVEWDLLPIARSNSIPPTTETRALGAWLLWFLSDSNVGDSVREIDRYPQLRRLLVAITFCPHLYPKARLNWYNFSQPLETGDTEYAPYHHVANHLMIASPLLGEAVHHLYFATLRLTPQSGSQGGTMTDRRSRGDFPPAASLNFDMEWFHNLRVSSSLPMEMSPAARSVYMPGSLAGVWEGMFALPNTDTHTQVVEGVSPIVAYDRTYISNHVQAWRIEEHVCMRSPEADAPVPHHPGGPLQAFLPNTHFRFLHRDGGVTLKSGDDRSVFYRTWRPRTGFNDEHKETNEKGSGDDESLEIIVTGEAIEPLQGLRSPSMMMPGSRLAGTIRRRDGMVTLRAESILPNSGEWLYIGRVLGTGVWMGRWRGLSQSAINVEWEGVFKMHKILVPGI